MSSANSDDISYMTKLGLEVSDSTTTSQSNGVFYYQRHLNSKNASPILVLIHGYPETNFMWHHVIPLLSPDIPLFIPDIPGYGRSAALDIPHDKVNVGKKILSALQSILPTTSQRPIILCGHDRGGRICHRLAVDRSQYPNFKILGSIIMDIVPTLTQWQSYSDPALAKASFHWPFLANLELATSTIMAQGGDVWAKVCLDRWSGSNEDGLRSFYSNKAIETYQAFFRKEEVVRASCDDYRAAAEEDVELQVEDQKAGRKMDCDVLVVYSEIFLGKRYDLKECWGQWMGEGKLEVAGIGNSSGTLLRRGGSDRICKAGRSVLQKPFIAWHHVCLVTIVIKVHFYKRRILVLNPQV